MDDRVLQIDPADDVVVALRDMRAGDTFRVAGAEVTAASDVPAKHKLAIRALPQGATVRMYGVVVGRVVKDVPEGGILTTTNVRHDAAPYEVRNGGVNWQPLDVRPWRGTTFSGYHRPDGRVGTANYWIVVPLVFCENRNVEVLRRALGESLGYDGRSAYAQQVRHLVDLYHAGAGPEALREAARALDGPDAWRPEPVFRNVSGIKFLTHGGGCGGTRDDARALCALLAAYVHHPNVAGATVLSLGCQNAQASLLQEELDRRGDPRKPVIVLEQQRIGAETKLIHEAIGQTMAGLVEANRAERAPAPLDRLVMGVECGGSDGFSGISANPAIGYAADLVVSLGGSAILSEFPELCGVEQELIDRCISREVATRFVELQTAYAARAEAIGASFDMNPSPGNIRDGLITDAMKSAGAARKGGSSPVVDVLDYPETVRRSGLNLLCTPGNDVESTTALAAAGANVILFSTGLGTPTGNPIVPVIKISSNTQLASHMSDVIDLDAGTVISGSASIPEVGERILTCTVEVASGRQTPAAVRLGQDDFLPWKRGISL